MVGAMATRAGNLPPAWHDNLQLYLPAVICARNRVHGPPLRESPRLHDILCKFDLHNLESVTSGHVVSRGAAVSLRSASWANEPPRPNNT